MIRSYFVHFINVILNKTLANIAQDISAEQHLNLQKKIKDYLIKDQGYEDLYQKVFFEEHYEMPLSSKSDAVFRLKEMGASLDVLFFERNDSINYLSDEVDIIELLKNFETKEDSYFSKCRSLFYRSCSIKSNIEEKILKEELNNQISSEDWNSLKDFYLGTSFILLCSLNLFKYSASELNRIYLTSCCERVLRKLEIGRAKFINFKDISLETSSHIEEQLRVIYFCLKMCEENRDLRFLNASMKAADRIFSIIEDTFKKPKFNLSDKKILFLYQFNIEIQERLFQEVT